MSGDQTTSRHSSWFAVAAFSTVSLVALTSAIPDGVDLGDLTKEYKWSVSAASISVALAGLAWFAHMAKDRFVGTVTEGGLVRCRLSCCVDAIFMLTVFLSHDISSTTSSQRLLLFSSCGQEPSQ